MAGHKISVLDAYDALHQNYVLLLTSNSTERKAFAHWLKNDAQVSVGHDHHGCTLGSLGKSFVLHLTGTSGAQENLSVGRLVKQLLGNRRMPQPTLVVLGGVCWGNPKLAQPFDVLVSTEVWAINHQRATPHGREYRPTQRLSALGSLENVLPTNVESSSTRVTVGPIASTETHFANAADREELLSQHPRFVGGEMEAYDFVPDLGNIPWVVIKGVADDAGDDVSRDTQGGAAKNAANVFAGLVEVLVNQETRIPAHRDDASSRSLLDSMLGHTVRIERPIKELELNDYLNDEIGPRILSKLRHYGFAENEGLVCRRITDFVLELSQNAIRHGVASIVTIGFNETSISINDNGKVFHLEALAGDGGGALSWQALDRELVQPGLIDVTRRNKARSEGRGNVYRLRFKQLSSDLAAAKKDCRVRIEYGRLGELSSRSTALNFDSACEALYIDVTSVLMTSRHLLLVRELAQLLAQGKGLFLVCRDDEEVDWYKGRLAKFAGPMLRIFPKGRE